MVLQHWKWSFFKTPSVLFSQHCMEVSSLEIDLAYEERLSIRKSEKSGTVGSFATTGCMNPSLFHHALSQQLRTTQICKWIFKLILACDVPLIKDCLTSLSACLPCWVLTFTVHTDIALRIYILLPNRYHGIKEILSIKLSFHFLCMMPLVRLKKIHRLLCFYLAGSSYRGRECVESATSNFPLMTKVLMSPLTEDRASQEYYGCKVSVIRTSVMVFFNKHNLPFLLVYKVINEKHSLCFSVIPVHQSFLMNGLLLKKNPDSLYSFQCKYIPQACTRQTCVFPK